MKKIFYITMILIMVLTSFVYASVGTKEETLHYMGIKINIDGQNIIPTDVNQNVVNPFIINGTTFLPVRAFSEAIGKEVRWDGTTSSIYISDTSGDRNTASQSGEVSPYTADVIKTLSYEDVKIYINNTYLEPKDVNGKVVEPFIIDGTTYLPVRAISEAYGKRVDWEDTTKTVKITSPEDNKVLTEVESGEYLVIKDNEITSIQNVEIKTINDTVTAEITTDKPVYKYRYFSLTEPQRLVLDIENSQFAMNTDSKIVNFGLVNQIRFGEQENHVSRIVLDLKESEKYTYTVVQNENKDKTYLALNENFILGTKVQNTISNNGTQTSVAPTVPTPTVTKMVENEVKPIDNNQNPVSPEPTKVADNTNENKDDDFYIVSDDLASLTSLTYSSATNRVKMKIAGDYSYDAFYLDNPTRIVVDIKNTKLDMDGLKEITPRNNNITAIRFSQNSSSVVRIVIDLDEKVDYQVEKSSKTLIVEIAEVNQTITKEEKPKATSTPTPTPTKTRAITDRTSGNRLIVVDAGHGGRDPGACNGTYYERDYNLKVVKKLEKLLQDTEGIDVVLTRTDNDTYMEASDRHRILLQHRDADLVVCVHHNSIKDSSYTGTMVLYCNKEGEKENYGITSEEFARIVKNKLVSKLGTIDRGVISRPDLVILNQNTNDYYPGMEHLHIPAMLCEVACMSNDAEMARIATDSFQQKAAEAIYEGILEALDQMK